MTSNSNRPPARVRPRIRKQGRRWEVQRPAFGFGAPSTATYDTWPDAIRSINPLGGIVSVSAELSFQPHDALGSVSPWSPIRLPPDPGVAPGAVTIHA